MIRNRWFTILLALALTLGAGSPALYAAPGKIAQSPLFLSAHVQPNIFFMIDDSGSMDWEILKSNEATQLYPEQWSWWWGWWFVQYPNFGYLNFTPTGEDEQLELCNGYNVMAYNPKAVYTPWKGKDSAGKTFQNQSLSSARYNPYYPWPTVSLKDHFYLVWNDADHDGKLDKGECPTRSGGITSVSQCRAMGSAKCVVVRDLPAAQQINYANWYTYYRKREFVAKRALSELITNSTARMGFSLINHIKTGTSTPVRDIDDISKPVDPVARSNKEKLLQNLFKYSSGGWTPLRKGLKFAGDYYENKYGAPWQSPILPASQGGECQQNFTILMSDGFWNGGSPGVGNTDKDGPGPWDGYSYADAWSDTLADVAMHYFERDLAPSLADKVPMTKVDVPLPSSPSLTTMHQHMVTFTVAFGVNGTLNSGPPSRTAPSFSWPKPVADDFTAVDDMRHAAWNGRGKFLSARDPQQLIGALNDTIAEIESRTATASAVTFNSTSLQAGTLVFQALFNSAKWSGELVARNVNPDGTIGAEAWRVTTAGSATGLDDPGFSWSTRHVYTWNGTAGAPFAWTSLTTDQQNDLRTNPDGSTGSVDAGKARLRYLLGDRSCEVSSKSTCSVGTFTAKQFRDRASRLGDIVHSSPYFVGVPSAPYPDDIEPGHPYSTFIQAHKGRKKVVYVGSNDGMLHAFDVGNQGTELFAYVPRLLSSTASGAGLHYLTDPNYGHRYYVDLSPQVGDAFFGGQWHTVLLGGLRGGGKGLFALDITDPSTFNETKVLWEFTHKDLGYSFSEAFVARLNNGKWAAIFGNGYNNDPNGDGHAKLFIVYLDGSNLTNPVIIDTHSGSIANFSCNDPASDCNGLSSPALADINGDGTVDRAYAGDLHGNLWVFDLSGKTASSWKLAYTKPLFHACSSLPCSKSNRQPITSRPALARHITERSSLTSPNIMVFFGTGQYLTAADNTSNTQQTFYGVWDGNTPDLDRGSLVAQTLTQVSTASGTFRFVTDHPVDYSTAKGWYIDLVSRERVVVDAHAIGDLVFFNTMIPSGGSCSFGGTSWLMSVDQFNGGVPSFVPFDTNGDGVIDTSDLVGGKTAVGTRVDSIASDSTFIGAKRFTATTSGEIRSGTVQANPIQKPYRTSWTTLDIE
ncbi:MAG: hypothetical protein D6721_02070 [Gammaproteobacteria bacterium]|nr:MAG: hypothetical protein D6721_02070 [Gammaproteobacteria bacterium]